MLDYALLVVGRVEISRPQCRIRAQRVGTYNIAAIEPEGEHEGDARCHCTDPDSRNMNRREAGSALTPHDDRVLEKQGRRLPEGPRDRDEIVTKRAAGGTPREVPFHHRLLEPRELVVEVERHLAPDTVTCGAENVPHILL